MHQRTMIKYVNSFLPEVMKVRRQWNGAREEKELNLSTWNSLMKILKN